MRGCLTGLLLVAVLVAAAAWFVTPLAVDALVAGSLTQSGFQGTGTTVDAVANPPPALLTGHADSIRIRSSDVTYRELHAATLDLTLQDVGLLSGSIDSVQGTLGGVRVVPETGPTIEATSATVLGPPGNATVRLTLDGGQVLSLVMNGLTSAAGPGVGSVRLLPPDKLSFSLGGTLADAALEVDGGALVLRFAGTNLGSVVLFRPATGAVWRLSSASMDGGRLVLVLLVDLGSLIH